VKKVIEPEIINNIFKHHNINKGTLLMVVDHIDIVNKSLGAIRNELGTLLNLKKPNDYRFL
jgi:aspartyl-tRNA synthetase